MQYHRSILVYVKCPRLNKHSTSMTRRALPSRAAPSRAASEAPPPSKKNPTSRLQPAAAAAIAGGGGGAHPFNGGQSRCSAVVSHGSGGRPAAGIGRRGLGPAPEFPQRIGAWRWWGAAGGCRSGATRPGSGLLRALGFKCLDLDLRLSGSGRGRLWWWLWPMVTPTT